MYNRKVFRVSLAPHDTFRGHLHPESPGRCCATPASSQFKHFSPTQSGFFYSILDFYSILWLTIVRDLDQKLFHLHSGQSGGGVWSGHCSSSTMTSISATWSERRSVASGDSSSLRPATASKPCRSTMRVKKSSTSFFPTPTCPV